MTLLSKAIGLAAHVHEGQVDKGGEEYILHCLAVMNMAATYTLSMRFTDPVFRRNVIIAAVLHDSVEDFDGTPAEKTQLVSMIERDFPREVSAAIGYLTHDKDVDYMDYIHALAASPIARVVKICDLMHNSDATRMPDREITQKDLDRWHKYRVALVYLERS